MDCLKSSLSAFTNVEPKAFAEIYRNPSHYTSCPSHIISFETMAHTILCNFEFDQDLVPNDVEHLLQQGTASAKKPIQPHRLRALQDNSRIKEWLSVGRPSLLPVNGNAASQADYTATFFSAKITNTLMQSRFSAQQEYRHRTTSVLLWPTSGQLE